MMSKAEAEPLTEKIENGSHPISPAAERALAEAAERRRAVSENADRPAEIDGRGGLEPVRYGDWEVKGLASDF